MRPRERDAARSPAGGAGLDQNNPGHVELIPRRHGRTCPLATSYGWELRKKTWRRSSQWWSRRVICGKEAASAILANETQCNDGDVDFALQEDELFPTDSIPPTRKEHVKRQHSS